MGYPSILARLLALIMLSVFWGLFGSPLLGVLFLLLMAALSVIRYRFAPFRWLMACEVAASVLFGLYWPPAFLGLWLPVLGALEDRWRAELHAALQRADEDRARLLSLESQKTDLARRQQREAGQIEAAERSRIAQDIHDHVGHEIAGALIALQTVGRLWDGGDTVRARDLLDQATDRVAQSGEHLRDTVHNLKPGTVVGLDELMALCAGFSFCPARLTASGDLSALTPSLWQLLIAVLKEALTNVSRHSDATAVTAALDSNGHHVRLVIRDNGSADQNAPSLRFGLGLSGMRERARAAGGSLSLSRSEGFCVTCVIPLGGEE